MSNRLAIDPSEIKISDPRGVRARLWAKLPIACIDTDEAPVVKEVIVSLRGDGIPIVVHKPVKPPVKIQRVLPKPVAPIDPADAVKLYRLAYASPGSAKTPLRQIVSNIARVYNVNAGEIIGHRRNKRICAARQHAYYAIATERPDISYPEIARHMGGKNHTTIMYGAAIFASRHGLPPVVRS